MIYLEAGALIAGLALIGLIWAGDRPEDLGRVSAGWMRRDREGEMKRPIHTAALWAVAALAWVLTAWARRDDERFRA